ncbi:MAG TPA: class I SAM-dependent methyltransferase [Candidatus Baltobacteraceae bacterium]|nr:class I SAM-dependent methyltransferase [Candidatus Baltobacteraceae bacterium]
MAQRPCRFCKAPLTETFVDLGMSPPSNAFLSREQTTRMERFYPLHAFVCSHCLLVQLEEFETPEQIFGEYAYFSSYSTSWLEHCKRYADEMVESLHLGSGDLVVELASNDGYLLQYFIAHGVPVLGIEPARNVAAVAVEKGVPTIAEFFGRELADKLAAAGRRADLIAANNVLAHVPDLNDFVAGVARLLKDTGTATFEFPHVLRLIESNQFDTIYHEHFSYFSLTTLVNVFAKHGLAIDDVAELSTHGGSLRLFVRHERAAGPNAKSRVRKVLDDEKTAGLDRIEGYLGFAPRVSATKRSLLTFLIEAKNAGKSIAAYGAAAKGTTLLNYCGVRRDFIEYIVDRNPHKQDTFLPGCHIPVVDPARIFETKPDYVLILPWNLKDEVMAQMTEIRSWGGSFVIPIPTVAVE